METFIMTHLSPLFISGHRPNILTDIKHTLRRVQQSHKNKTNPLKKLTKSEPKPHSHSHQPTFHTPTMHSHFLSHFFLFFFLVPLLCLLLLSFPHTVHCQCSKRPPVIFNFGDSNSDTGGLAAGLGFPINSPNGRIFFHRSTGRFSDGRLLIDLLCKWDPPP